MNELNTILRVVDTRRQRAATYLTWFGNRIADLAAETAVTDLQNVLYHWAYTTGTPTPQSREEPATVDSGWSHATVDPRLRPSWSGWRVTTPTTVRFDNQPTITLADPVAGQTSVTLPLPAMSHDTIPGWLLIRHGDATTFPPQPYRLYLNTDAEAIRALLPSLTALLADQLPMFSAKFLTSHDHSRRTDSTVIYLPAIPGPHLLQAVITLTRPAISRSACPMFTTRLNPGVAAAPSPPGGRSYGMEVCNSLAEHIVTSYRSGTTPVATTWVAPGPLPRPTLSDPAPDTPAEREQPAPGLGRPSTGGSAQRGRGDPLAVLDTFTRRLFDETLTDGRQATWLSSPDRAGRRTLGAQVYDGMPGPLLVLAYAVQLTENGDARRLLRAVATSTVARQSELSGLGFHTGQLGTAAALAEASHISADPELADLAHTSLQRALSSIPTHGSEWDVISGVSGAVLALVATTHLLADCDTGVSALAVDLRARLPGLSEPDALTTGTRWRLRTGRSSRTLAGLAHGGTGAALALMVGGPSERWAVDLARRSVLFEDRARHNGHDWLDYRSAPLTPAATAWCHGAAGIGIGTVGVLAADPPADWIPQLRERIVRAADRTRKELQHITHDEGLCHGASGRAVALKMMSDSLGTPLDGRELMDRIARVAAQPAAVGDLTLMNGESGRIIARLVLEGLAAPPVAFSLIPASRGCGAGGTSAA